MNTCGVLCRPGLEAQRRRVPGLPSPSGGELGVLAPLCLSLEPLAAALQEGPTQLKGGWGGAEGAGVTAEGRCCQALGFWPGFGLGFVHYLLLLLAPFPNTGWNPALSCWKVKQRVRVSLAPPPYPVPSACSAPVGACSGGETAESLCCPVGAGTEAPDRCGK